MQLIENDGVKIRKDHAHIKEFTPTGLNDDKSFHNTDDDEEEDDDYGQNEVKLPIQFLQYQEDELVEVKSQDEEEQNKAAISNVRSSFLNSEDDQPTLSAFIPLHHYQSNTLTK